MLHSPRQHDGGWKVQPVNLMNSFDDNISSGSAVREHDQRFERRFHSEAVAIVMYSYQAQEEDELSMVKGEKLHIINKFPDEWLLVQNSAGALGVVPGNHVVETTSIPIGNMHSDDGDAPNRTPRSISRSLNRHSPSYGDKPAENNRMFGSFANSSNFDKGVQQVQQQKQKTRAIPMSESQAPRERRRVPPRDKENFLDAIISFPASVFGPICDGYACSSCIKPGQNEGLLAQRRASPVKIERGRQWEMPPSAR